MGYSAISKCVNQSVMTIFGEASMRRDKIGVWQRRLRLCCRTGISQNLQVASVLSISATRCAKTCPKAPGRQMIEILYLKVSWFLCCEPSFPSTSTTS